MQGNGREGPRLAHAAAEHAACVIKTGELCLGAGQDRAAGCVEIFVHGDVHRVEERGVLFDRPRRVGAFQKEAGAIEMQSDVVGVRPGGDLLHLREVEAFAAAPPHRSFDLDGADGSLHASHGGVVGGAFHVFETERSAAGRERHQMQAAEGLGAIATIVEEVAFGLDTTRRRLPASCGRRDG